MNLLGAIINNCYIIREKISANSLGTLWLAQPIFSAQQFLLFFFNQELLKQEKKDIILFKRKVFSSFADIHENIANIVEIDEYNENVYLSFEVGEGISLVEYIKKESDNISFINIYSIMEYIGKVVEAIHKKGIIHGMLLADYIWLEKKGNNIKGVKILNFYFDELKNIMNFNINSEGENKRYFPPELIENYLEGIDEKSDLYFMGIAFYILLTTNINFTKNSIENINNLDINLENEESKNICSTILKKLLNKNKKERYNDITAFLNDFYLLSERVKKTNIKNTKIMASSRSNLNYNVGEYLERLEKERKEGEKSSKDREKYFNKLESDRKKYYDKSDYEERKIFFEKLEKERKEYYNRISKERKLYLDSLVNETRKYLSELSDRKNPVENISNRQNIYFEEMTKRTRAYADIITDETKKYYDNLSKASKNNIDKSHLNFDVMNSFFNNSVFDNRRYYKNLAEESQKYYINLTNEAKRYSDGVGEYKVEEKIDIFKDADDRRNYYDDILKDTVEYFTKLEKEIIQYSDKIIRERMENAALGDNRDFGGDNGDRQKYYKDQEESSATVKYFEDYSENKLQNRDVDTGKYETFSDYERYLEERKKYYKNQSDNYIKKDADYFIAPEESDKPKRDTIDQKEGDSNLYRGDVNYSIRNDFVKNKQWLLFLKKLFKDAYKSNGNICFINVEEYNELELFLAKFKDYNVKKGSIFIDIRCEKDKSSIIFVDILKEYSDNIKKYGNDVKKEIENKIFNTQRDSISLIIKNYDKKNKKIFDEDLSNYNFNISDTNEEALNVASDFFCNLGEKDRPLVIVLRDIQYIDDSSLYILNKMITKITEHALLFICIFRENELGDNVLLKTITA